MVSLLFMIEEMVGNKLVLCFSHAKSGHLGGAQRIRSWFWVVEVKLVRSWMLLHVEFVVLTSFLGSYVEIWCGYLTISNLYMN